MLEIRRNIYVLRRWWWLVLVAAVVCAAVALAATKLLVKERYQATALVSLAPAPQGPNGLSITSLSAAADAQLVSTLATAQSARNHLPASIASSVSADKLAHAVTGQPSLDGQLLYVTVTWTDQTRTPILANAVAEAYITQERSRLKEHYGIIHGVYVREEQSLSALARRLPTSGPAASWARAQNADAASRLYSSDAEARIQASLQTASLQMAQPASSLEIVKIGPKGSVNALLGGALGALLALIFAFVQTSSYEAPDRQPRSVPSMLTKVGE